MKKIWQVARRKNVRYGAAVAVILALGIFFLCRDNAGAVNVVRDIEPVRQTTPEQDLVLSSLEGKDPGEIKTILDREWPTLGSSIVGWLRSTNRITPSEEVTSVEYMYGSGQADGEDGQGQIHSGYFEDELLAKVTIAGRNEPLVVAVRCLNGLFRIQGDGINTIAEDEINFTIGRRKALVDYVSYETSIYLAEYFNLPIYKGRGRSRRAVDPTEARATNTDDHQIMVLVFAGDEFDIGNMTYNGQGQ